MWACGLWWRFRGFKSAVVHSDRQQGESVELGAPVMIKQQNVSSHVKPCFDQFSFPPLVSSIGEKKVELCVCKQGKHTGRHLHTEWFVLCQGIKGREGVDRQCVVTRTHKTNTEAFCVSPSATDLPFVYSALPGYSLWFGCAHVTLRQFLLCSAAAKNSLMQWLHS